MGLKVEKFYSILNSTTSNANIKKLGDILFNIGTLGIPLVIKKMEN